MELRLISSVIFLMVLAGLAAAISISAVANRVSRDLETEFARLIIATAEIISGKLGYKKP
jgi:DNA-binding IclR family transcriptional regulator